MRARLWFQIWLTFLATTLLAMWLAASVAVAMREEAGAPPVLVAHLTPLFEGDLNAAADQYEVALARFDAAGQRVAGSPGTPHEPPCTAPGMFWSRIGPGIAVGLSNGDLGLVWLDPGHGRRHWTQHGLIMFGALGVVAAGTWLVARRITRRLEHLGKTAAQWEAGNLSVRSNLAGTDEVADLGRRFDAAAERLQDVLNDERRLLAGASHEFRAPLARIRMALELLDDGSSHAAGAKADVGAIDELVAELLATTRGAARALDFRAADLAQLVRDVDPDVSVTGSAYTKVDAALVRRAVRNLLDNARRHGGGVASVHVGERPAHIAVANVGDGPPNHLREAIFTPFFRPEGHGEDAGGTGLGLALVRAVGEAHGGGAAFEVGPPATFVLTLEPTAAADGRGTR